jgi:hypothetical protein
MRVRPPFRSAQHFRTGAVWKGGRGRSNPSQPPHAVPERALEHEPAGMFS